MDDDVGFLTRTEDGREGEGGFFDTEAIPHLHHSVSASLMVSKAPNNVGGGLLLGVNHSPSQKDLLQFHSVNHSDSSNPKPLGGPQGRS